MRNNPVKWFFTTAVLSTSLTGCHIYKMPIQQGRLISDKKLKSLHTGMTIHQVKARLGSPLLRTAYRSNRLTYVYYTTNSKGKKQTQTTTLTFDANLLSSISSKKEG